MRNGAPLLLVLTIATLTSPGLAAESRMLIGKQVSWESWDEQPKEKSTHEVDGDAQETPNHKRRRLGLPIEAAFPAQEQGVAEETPNHRRQREALSRLAQATSLPSPVIK